MTNLADFLRTQAAEHGDRPFVRFRDERMTFAEFDAVTDKVAAGLAASGVKPGDVVSVFLPNHIRYLEAWWGIVKAGGVFGPVNPAFTGSEAKFVISFSESVAVITSDKGKEIIDSIMDDLPTVENVYSIDDGSFDELRESDGDVPDCDRAEDDLAHILYTSGTTGQPKGAMLSHGNVLTNAWQVAELVPLVPGDRVGMILPLFHANAQIATCVMPLMIGCEVVMWDGFSGSKFWDMVEEHEPATISAVPTILSALLNAAKDRDVSKTSLRYVVCGAAPLSKEMLTTFQDKFGIRILEGYGLTETTCVSSLNPFYGTQKAGSIGLPVRGQLMEIRDEDDNQVAQGEKGEICIQGANVMMGYLKNEESTSESLVDGWLHTGDVGIVDEDGYFFIVDRTKDMIIRGGENIYPREIEEVLYEFEGVLEAAVIGVPDDHRGEEVLAIVVAKDGADIDADEILEFTKDKLAKFKHPRAVEIKDELPKTPTGKISKGPLREEYGHWATSK
ncbi:MAG: long-chain acyl-CoA synthetase [Solirubrobacteraceae bacterium]|nr:long-chain acyl-CoA synthetase [Solirubrobacteraceae bacterium]